MTDTSLAAHESIQDSAGVIRDRIEVRIGRTKEGLTCDEVEVQLDLRHQTASARIRELRSEGRIYDTGERRPTRSGRPAIVWKVS